MNSTLIDKVIAGGYCVGCGACTVAPVSSFEMRFGNAGTYQAVRRKTAESSETDCEVDSLCPFTGKGPNESELGKELYGAFSTPDDHLGHILAAYAGYVREGTFRERGSSGGFVSWIAVELLRLGEVDAVVHVKPAPRANGSGVLFEYSVSSSASEVGHGSKSRYYPVQLSKVLKSVREKEGRYLFIGLPCFVKAVRLLAKSDPTLRERIRFCVSLVCGHLKSARFADMLAWQCGVVPGRIEEIDFRTKVEGKPSGEYAVTVSGKAEHGPVHKTLGIAGLFGGDWSHCLFQYEACDFCDDVVGETADASIGDAWLPKYEEDWRGTNLVLMRNPALHAIVVRAQKDDRIHLERISLEDAKASQAGGFRQRRDGLAVRLFLKDQAGEWRPPKRVQPSIGHLRRPRRKTYVVRNTLAKRSHLAFQKAVDGKRFQIFRDELAPLVWRLQVLQVSSSPARFIKWVKFGIKVACLRCGLFWRQRP